MKTLNSKIKIIASVFGLIALGGVYGLTAMKETSLDQQLLAAAEQGKIQEVQKLLDEGADVNTKGEHDVTPLHLVAEKGHTQIIQKLLSSKANVDAKAQGNVTPLHLATMGNHVAAVKVLLNAGADPTNKITRGPVAGKNAFEMAEQYSNVETQKVLGVPNINPITERALTTLYKTYVVVPFIKEELFDAQGKPFDLKVLFKSKGLCLNLKHGHYKNFWDKKQEEVNSMFIRGLERQKKYIKDVPVMNSLDELPKLLTTAKSVLKSFLLSDDSKLSSIQEDEDYIRKGVVNKFERLYTYTKLQRVIERRKLKHISLPRKMLVIKDYETKKLLPHKEAAQFIDDNLKICVDPYDGGFKIGFPFYLSGRYEPLIYARKQKNYGQFSKQTMDELQILCHEAPFDIGYDNIFAQENEDAIIIDTEYKGSSQESCSKLKRYR